MNTISDFEKQKEVDSLAWQWFSRSIGFWAWFTTTVYIWKNQISNLDHAATVGLAVGVVIWIIAKLITMAIGEEIIYINLWEYGCGCLIRIISIELFHYFAIATICILAVISGELTAATAIIFFIIGALNWLLVSIKNL